MDRPSDDQCSEHAVLSNSDTEITYADWHPQIGGYGSPCVVQFDKISGCQRPGCFEVHNFHDGEFPTDQIADVKHYCDAGQMIDFALTVLEKQVAHRSVADSPSTVSDSWKERVTKRINALPSE